MSTGGEPFGRGKYLLMVPPLVKHLQNPSIVSCVVRAESTLELTSTSQRGETGREGELVECSEPESSKSTVILFGSSLNFALLG